MSSNQVPIFTLNTGAKIPSIGLGCWMGDLDPKDSDLPEIMCKDALKVGYRHFDTAFRYRTEKHVGKAIRDSGIPREEIFVTTKLLVNDTHSVKEYFEMSLQQLGLDYIDLYLMHWPQAIANGKVLQPEEHPNFVDTWKEMEKLLDTGKVRAIGVSNFSIKLLDKLLPECSVIPAVNQVQLHPCWPQEDLRKYCADREILLTAYSPFGQYKPILMENKDLLSIASKHNLPATQIIVSWLVQRGISVVPKTSKPERMLQQLSPITLSDEDMNTLNSLYKQPNMHRSLFDYPGFASTGKLVGWAPEQLGWPLNNEGLVVE